MTSETSTSGSVIAETEPPVARPAFDQNTKFKVLVRDLGLPRPYVRGLLDTMWETCHATGNPIIGDEESVEAAAEWPGEPGVFFSALSRRGWIEQSEDGRWMVHDYWEHCPDYVLDRLRKELERKGFTFGRDELKIEAREHPAHLREHLLQSRIIPDNPGHGTDSPGLSSSPAPTPTPAPAPAPLEREPTPPPGGSRPKQTRFKPPTLEEVRAHVEEKGYGFSPDAFVAHYESNGWMVGRNKMKNWRSACVTWQKNDFGGRKREPEVNPVLEADLRAYEEMG